MKTLKIILFFFLLLCTALPIHSQGTTVPPERTPEQEAGKQTGKLQQELNLTAEQSKQMYEINLRYERQRQVSNTRSEAMERIKNKNADIQRILSEEQNNILQNKRYERSTLNSQSINRNQQPVNSSGFRSSPEYRTNPSNRNFSTDMNMRNGYRTTNSQTRNGVQSPQTDNRNTTITPRTQQNQNNPSSTRSSVSSPSAPTRTESNSASQSNSSSRSQSSSTPRSTTPSNSNRR